MHEGRKIRKAVGETDCAISIRQCPHSGLATIDVLQKLAQFRIRLDHVFKWQRPVALLVKVEGIYVGKRSIVRIRIEIMTRTRSRYLTDLMMSDQPS